jgi:hypothetical protein
VKNAHLEQALPFVRKTQRYMKSALILRDVPFCSENNDIDMSHHKHGGCVPRRSVTSSMMISQDQRYAGGMCHKRVPPYDEL